jgi:hypothetical protein
VGIRIPQQAEKGKSPGRLDYPGRRAGMFSKKRSRKEGIDPPEEMNVFLKKLVFQRMEMVSVVKK